MSREGFSYAEITDYSNYNYQNYDYSSKPDPGRPRRKRRIALWKKLVFLAFAFIIFLLGQNIYEQKLKIQEGMREIEELEAQLERLEYEHDRLKFRESRMYDEDYIAELARQKFHLSKPGEILFISPKN